MKRKIMTFALAFSLMGASLMSPQAQASEDSLNFGTIIGAVGGGLIGSKFGKGDGQLVGVATGTLIGAAVGTELGKPSPKPTPKRVTQRWEDPDLRPVPRQDHFEWYKEDHDDYRDDRQDRRLDRIEGRMDRMEDRRKHRKWHRVARYDDDILICHERSNRCKWVD